MSEIAPPCRFQIGVNNFYQTLDKKIVFIYAATEYSYVGVFLYGEPHRSPQNWRYDGSHEAYIALYRIVKQLPW